MKFLPQGQNLYKEIFSFRTFPLSKKNSRISHMHWKSAFPQKPNPSLYLLYPMHLNKLLKDGTCWVHYVLTPLVVMFFSRRSRRWLRRRRWRVVRVSPPPKLLLVVFGVRSVLPPCKVYGLWSFMKEPFKGLYKTLCFIMYATSSFLYHFCSSVRTSYWSRDWYGKHSRLRKRGPILTAINIPIC